MPLFRIFGVLVRLHYSWFLVFLLLLWLLAGVVFPGSHPGQPALHLWVAGVLGSLLFFASVLAHELSHSLVARALGLQVLDITLFVFGGVSRLATDPEDAWTEIKVALAGPLMSFFLGAFFLAGWAMASASGGTSPLVPEVLRYLAMANLVLGLFNLVPGFPLDGGRVLRALWWLATGSVSRATRIAARAGSAVAVGITALGGLQILAGSLGGLWLILIGLFLWTAAGAAGRDGELRALLSSARVAEVMIRDPLAIPAEASVHQAGAYFLDPGDDGLPVVRDGTFCGLVTPADLDRVPAGERDGLSVGEVMTPRRELPTVEPGDPVRLAVERMSGAGLDHLPVVAGGEVVGLIGGEDVRRFLRLRRSGEPRR